jgi:hypothetical protein
LGGPLAPLGGRERGRVIGLIGDTFRRDLAGLCRRLAGLCRRLAGLCRRLGGCGV